MVEMDDGEIDMEFALKVHGLNRKAWSESDSDHDSDFEEYEKYQPPPVEVTSENVIVIYPSGDDDTSSDITNMVIKLDCPNLTNIKPHFSKFKKVNSTSTHCVYPNHRFTESFHHPNDQADKHMYNINSSEITTKFPNHSSSQCFCQTTHNANNPHVMGIRPNFSNVKYMGPYHKSTKNDYTITPGIFPNSSNRSNMQYFHRPSRGYDNFNVARIRPDLPNPSNVSHFKKTSQQASNFNIGNTNAAVLNQQTYPLLPKSIHLSPRTLNIIKMLNGQDNQTAAYYSKGNHSKSDFPKKNVTNEILYEKEKFEISHTGDIFQNTPHIQAISNASVEELVRAHVICHLLEITMTTSVIKQLTINCIPTEFNSKVKEQFDLVISELGIYPESIIYLYLCLKINELISEYHEKYLPLNSNTEYYQNSHITKTEHSSTTMIQTGRINSYGTKTYSQKCVSKSATDYSFEQNKNIAGTKFKSIDSLKECSTGAIPKKRKEKKSRKACDTARKLYNVDAPNAIPTNETKHTNTYKQVSKSIEIDNHSTAAGGGKKLINAMQECGKRTSLRNKQKNKDEDNQYFCKADKKEWNHLEQPLITGIPCNTVTSKIDRYKSELSDFKAFSSRNDQFLTHLNYPRYTKKRPPWWTRLRILMMGYVTRLTYYVLRLIANNPIKVCTTIYVLWMIRH